jgi:hypothetical protein
MAVTADKPAGAALRPFTAEIPEADLDEVDRGGHFAAWSLR